MKNIYYFLNKISILAFLYFFLITSSFISEAKSGTLQLNEPTPIFYLRSLENENVFLRDYCGELRQPWKNKTKHIVIISFFTTYCKPCLKEIPVLEEIYESFKTKNIAVFLIDLKEDHQLVKDFVQKQGIHLPILLDKYGIVAQKYEVTSVPRLFVINQEGMLIWQTSGYSENLKQELNQLLQSLTTNEAKN